AAVAGAQAIDLPGVRDLVATYYPTAPQPSWDRVYRPASLLGHYSAVGAFGLLNLMLALVLAATRQAGFPGWWLALVMAANMLSLIASETYAPLAALPVGVVAALLVVRRIPPSHPTPRLPLVAPARRTAGSGGRCRGAVAVHQRQGRLSVFRGRRHRAPGDAPDPDRLLARLLHPRVAGARSLAGDRHIDTSRGPTPACQLRGQRLPLAAVQGGAARPCGADHHACVGGGAGVGHEGQRRPAAPRPRRRLPGRGCDRGDAGHHVGVSDFHGRQPGVLDVCRPSVRRRPGMAVERRYACSRACSGGGPGGTDRPSMGRRACSLPPALAGGLGSRRRPVRRRGRQQWSSDTPRSARGRGSPRPAAGRTGALGRAPQRDRRAAAQSRRGPQKPAARAPVGQTPGLP